MRKVHDQGHTPLHCHLSGDNPVLFTSLLCLSHPDLRLLTCPWHNALKWVQVD